VFARVEGYLKEYIQEASELSEAAQRGESQASNLQKHVTIRDERSPFRRRQLDAVIACFRRIRAIINEEIYVLGLEDGPDRLAQMFGEGKLLWQSDSAPTGGCQPQELSG